MDAIRMSMVRQQLVDRLAVLIIYILEAVEDNQILRRATNQERWRIRKATN